MTVTKQTFLNNNEVFNPLAKINLAFLATALLELEPIWFINTKEEKTETLFHKRSFRNFSHSKNAK